MRTYTTIQGDMRDKIAYTQLGDVAHTDKLINANLWYREYYIPRQDCPGAAGDSREYQ